MYDLESISDYYKIEDDFDMVYMQHNYLVAKDYFVGDAFLELGCATGESTLATLQFAKSIDVVEGSQKNIDITKKKLEDLGDKAKDVEVNFYESYWEEHDYEDNAYSDILFFRGLEHLENPTPTLEKMHAAVKPGGRCHIVVPNANSLHRKIGVQMGMLDEVHQLNERDKQVGHYKVYDLYLLIETLKKHNFRIVDWRGVMLKVLPNGMMMDLTRDNKDLIKGFFEVGKELPDKCAELYICVEPVK